MRISPFSAFSIELRHALGAAQLVLVALEGAGDEDRVERAAVDGGEDLRVDDVGAGRRAGAGDDREQARMVRREHGELGHAAEGVGRDLGRERCAPAFSAALIEAARA